RIGARRFVTIVFSASPRSRLLVRSSRRMMPALLIRTLSPGFSATTRLAKPVMASGSSTSSVIACMRSRPAIVSSRASRRRPAIMIVLPTAWKLRANSRPIPDPPPVMSIVFPLILIGLHSIRSAKARSDNPAVREDRLSVDPGAVAAAERGNRVGNVGRLAETLVRSARSEAGDLLGRLSVGKERRVDHAGSQSIHGDHATLELLGEDIREQLLRGFGDGIGPIGRAAQLRDARRERNDPAAITHAPRRFTQHEEAALLIDVDH